MKHVTHDTVRITGAGFQNKGAEAMLLTVAEAIRRNFPGTTIVARVRSMEFSDVARDAQIVLEKEPPKSLLKRITNRLTNANVIHPASFVIDVSGYQFGDPWGPRVAKRKAMMTARWIRSRIPVFYLPQTWGPFADSSIGVAVRSIVATATLSFARDKQSLSELQQLLGNESVNLHFAHDIAWNFRGDDLWVGKKLIEDAGLCLSGGKLTVCLTPNTQVFKRSKGPPGADNDYIVQLRRIAKHLCENHNAQIVLLGHHFHEHAEPNKEDDRMLCDYIMSSLDRALPVVRVGNVLTSAQIKSVIGNCDLLLSSRYHALIAAMSQGIPAAAIGWSHKYDELMSEVGLSSNVIVLSRRIEDVLGEIDALVGRMAAAREILKSTVPSIKQSGQASIDKVVSAIKEIRKGGCGQSRVAR